MEIAGNVKLAFHKVKNTSVIVCEDELCRSLVFVLNGSFCTEHVSDDRAFSLMEWGSGPAVVQPENLFGLHTRYASTVRAVGDVHLLEIDKHAVTEILARFDIFRINFLNLVSSQAQYSRRRLWKSQPERIEGRFAQFVADRSARPAGHKALHINMVRLADELCVTRLTVSKMLRKLEEKGLLQVGRQRIDIPMFERLLQEISAVG